MDSWGKLIKITFTDDGQVLYSGRMIETENYIKCAEEERLVPTITAAAVKPNDWTMEEFMEESLSKKYRSLILKLILAKNAVSIQRSLQSCGMHNFSIKCILRQMRYSFSMKCI